MKTGNHFWVRAKIEIVSEKPSLIEKLQIILRLLDLNGNIRYKDSYEKTQILAVK